MMNIDALVSAPVGYTVHAAGADWVKGKDGIWLPDGEEWAEETEGLTATSLAGLNLLYENGDRWFILDEYNTRLSGPVDEMPSIDECALVGGGPGRRALGSTWLD